MASTSAEIQLAQIPTGPNATHRRSRSTTSNEITVEQDLESGSPPISCRICMEDGGRQGNELIAPCCCKGTQEFVHRDCLDHWRSEKEGYAFTHCTTCQAAFKLQMMEVKYDILTGIKHQLFVAGDVFCGCLVLQIMIALFGGSLFFVDYKGAIQNIVNSYSTLFSSSKSSIHFYYIMGVCVVIFLLGSFCMVTRAAYFVNADQRIAAALNIFLIMLMYQILPIQTLLIIAAVVVFICGIGYGLFLAIMGVQSSWHRHYKVLFKRNLTQVYVVVDQRGHYTPPTPDPILEQRLRALHLL